MNPGEWKACAIALESFPGDFAPRQAEAYRELLEGLSYDEVMSGIQRHVRLGERWRPSPGEIVKLAGRSVALPPFGMLRQLLTQACRSTPVRLARSNVGDAICGELGGDHLLAVAFVRAIGGERIRRVALYVPEEQEERAWSALARDYVEMGPFLTDQQFVALETAEDQPKLPR